LLHAWPEQRVFIDGGTDHYGDQVFNEYIQIQNLEPGWRDIMKRRGIDVALVPPQSRLAHELARDHGWQVWYCDSTAVILRGGRDVLRAFRPDSTFASCSLPKPPQE
jgi:hypothetical protein